MKLALYYIQQRLLLSQIALQPCFNSFFRQQNNSKARYMSDAE